MSMHRGSASTALVCCVLGVHCLLTHGEYNGADSVCPAFALVPQISAQHVCPASYGAAASTAPRRRDRNSAGGTHIRADRRLGAGAAYVRYIVRLKKYDTLDSVEQTLALELQHVSRSYRWSPRNALAKKHPTDFALMDVLDTAAAGVLALLLRLPFVKDIHLDRRVSSQLLASTAEQLRAEQAGAHSLWSVERPPGRPRTSFSSEAASSLADGNSHDGSFSRRSRQLLREETLTSMLGAEQIWKHGFTGKGVRVGVFDTGIRADHPHIRNIRERTNWTHQNSLSDGLGHGTFVAGVIGGSDSACPGVAPDVELYTFKVFTDDQVSYTSWFLDAFNYAIALRVHVINLSIGGPDFLDLPFVEKVWEVTSHGILMVSAIGNDGPLYGTLNNPADQNDVIGVGGVDNWDHIASFSSRGMSTWELPTGSGRMKPDIMAYAKDVHGSRIQGGCRTLSGTSVASPVVAGAVCLLASTVPEAKRWRMLNPASMKQALVAGAQRLPRLNAYEQGHGRLDLAASKAFLDAYEPRASLLPGVLNFTDCPYLWPYCRQPLYATSLPLVFNATVLNALGVTGAFEGAPVFTPSNELGRALLVEFEYSEVLWPWSGFLVLYVHVKDSVGAAHGVAEGVIEFRIRSEVVGGGTSSSLVRAPLAVEVVAPPPRAKRVLWDQLHSIKYPPAYIPRDNLDVKSDILDWHGDHLFTNYHGLYDHLRDEGYFVEVLSSPVTCVNASFYSALLLVDSEDEFYPEEIEKVASDVQRLGLSLLVFAEWYHVPSMMQMKFFDDNTRSWWTPATGGANVPALNDLLKPFGIAFGDAILQGSVTLGSSSVTLSYAANVARVPAGAYLHSAQLSNVAGKGAQASGTFGVLAVVRAGQGAVGVFGDSNCLDSSHQSSACYGLLTELLGELEHSRRTARADAPDAAAGGASSRILSPERRVAAAWASGAALPERRADVNFTEVSYTKSHVLHCRRNTRCALTPNLQGCVPPVGMPAGVHTADGRKPAGFAGVGVHGRVAAAGGGGTLGGGHVGGMVSAMHWSLGLVVVGVVAMLLLLRRSSKTRLAYYFGRNLDV